MMPFDQHFDRAEATDPVHVRRPKLRLSLSTDENILSRRPWYIVGLAMLGVSLLLRDQVLFVAGLAVIALGAIPEI
jgi:hypothetical protein